MRVSQSSASNTAHPLGEASDSEDVLVIPRSTLRQVRVNISHAKCVWCHDEALERPAVISGE